MMLGTLGDSRKAHKVIHRTGDNFPIALVQRAVSVLGFDFMQRDAQLASQDSKRIAIHACDDSSPEVCHCFVSLAL